jgi:O-antigen/teichoic acid export membrane protein
MPMALKLTGQLLRYYLVMIVPAFLLVTFHAPSVLTLLFGDAYAEAANVLVFLLAALPFVAISSSLQLLLRALPRPLGVLLARGGGAAVLLALALLLIPRMQATGAAIALASGEAIGAALMFLFVRRATGGTPWDWRTFAPLVAGAAAASLYLVVGAWPIMLKLPLAAALYAALVFTLRGMTAAEVRDLTRLLASVLRPRNIPKPTEAGFDE